MHPYDIVDALEQRVAEYGGSKYAVAVDSCTNALLIALKYFKMKTGLKTAILPNRTYVGVAYSVINAGMNCEFIDHKWQGSYRIVQTSVIDSARRFKRGMYIPNTLYCLSAHWGKHLKIGRGGFILTDDFEAYETLKTMRFDGRTAKVDPDKDNFVNPSNHCYMLPEEAARGLMLMNYMPDDNDDLSWDNYPDLSTFPIFRAGI